MLIRRSCTMSNLDEKKSKAWCIVVADDHGPEYVPTISGSAKKAAVLCCGFGEPSPGKSRGVQ